MLRNILGLIALVFLFTACTKDAELFTSDEVKTHRVASSDEVADDDGDGVANTGNDTGDGEDGGAINDDDDDEDDDESDINDDDDDEDDDESNSVKDVQMN